MSRRKLAWLLMIGFTAGPWAQAETDGASADPARWAPADALLYFGVSGVEAAWEEFTRSADYRMLNDPEARDANSRMRFLHVALDKLRDQAGTMLKTAPEQLKSPFRGGVALFGVIPPGGSADDLEPVLVAEVGDAELMRRYYDQGVARLKESANRYETETVGRHTIDVFTTPKRSDDDEEAESDDDLEDDLDAPGLDPEALAAALERRLERMFSSDNLPPKLATCFTGEQLIIAATAEQVRATLRREQQGEHLADQDDYRLLARRYAPLGRVRCFLNLRGFVRMLAADAKDDPKERDMQKSLGLESLRAALMHGGYDVAARRWRLDGQVLTAPERTGLVELLSFANRATAPPAGVSGDTCYYLSANISLPALLDSIEKMVRQADPAAADQLRDSITQFTTPTGETLDLRRDLIDHLQAPLTLRMAFPRPYSARTARVLISCGQRDRAGLNRLFGQFPGLLQPRDARGTPLFDIPFLQISLAASADELLLGPAHAVEPALERNSAESLAERESFRRLAREAPAESWLAAYADERELLAALLDTADAEDATAGFSLTATLLTVLRQQFLETVDEQPEKQRRLLKYSGQSLTTISTLADGIRITYLQQQPEEN